MTSSLQEAAKESGRKKMQEEAVELFSLPKEKPVQSNREIKKLLKQEDIVGAVVLSEGTQKGFTYVVCGLHVVPPTMLYCSCFLEVVNIWVFFCTDF